MTHRPVETGESDALGRPIKISEHAASQRATAPPPDDHTWPGIDHEAVEWQSSVPTANTRIEALRPRVIQVAVPAEIAGRQPQPSADVTEMAREAEHEIIRFDAELGAEIGPLNSILMRSESAASSQIEHLTASAKAILMAEVGDTSRSNATEIAANTAAMSAATALADEITGDTIIRMHAALLSGTAPHITGRFRDETVRIGGRGSSPTNATYVAPRHERVPALIDDLVRFAGENQTTPLTKALIAHAQFETIHPFPDGNGRTGRALIHAMLRHDRLTNQLTVPVSAGMLTDTDRYFASLTAYRNGDIDPIVEHGAESTFRAIHNGRQLADEINEAMSTWRSHLAGVRRDAVAWRVVENLPSHPVVDANSIAQRYGVSTQAATTAIAHLEDRGIVSRANAGLRFRKWIAHDVASALDRFAERAGRRA